MNKTINGRLFDFAPQNNRICKTRLKGRFRNMTAISAHVPTSDKDDQVKERFY